MKIRATVTIKGLVQGVNFRHYTREAATMHNVTGWVKNLYNGDVQGCFEGEERDVNALIDWCRHGPKWASVDEVIVEKGDYKEEFSVFEVRH